MERERDALDSEVNRLREVLMEAERPTAMAMAPYERTPTIQVVRATINYNLHYSATLANTPEALLSWLGDVVLPQCPGDPAKQYGPLKIELEVSTMQGMEIR